MGNNYGSNPAVIVQPAWPPHVVTTTAEGQNGGPNQRINGEIQYEIIEAHEVKTPTNLTRVVTMQPTSLHNGAFSQFFSDEIVDSRFRSQNILTESEVNCFYSLPAPSLLSK